VYAKTCQQCHTLYAVGGKVGPDITGSNRANLDYLLENVFDPSAVIPKEYAATRFNLADGRDITGILKGETPAAVTVVTENETLPEGEMKGQQADIGAGWWCKLYEESGRGLLAKEGGEKHVKPDEWNDYVVEAKGDAVKIWINGQLVCDYTDPKLSKRGVIG